MPKPAINLSTLPAELQQVWLDDPVLVQTAMYDGMEELRSVFNIVPSDGRTPFPVLTLLDKLKIATNDFDPDTIADLGVRIPELKPFEIDTEIPYSDIEAYAQMWANGLFESRQLLKETADFSFAQAMLLKFVDEAFMRNFALKGAFYGTRTTDTTMRGGGKVVDGLIKKISDAIADGTIKESNVVEFTTNGFATGDAAAVYDNVQAVCKKATRNTDLLGFPLICVLSEEHLELYAQHRATLYPNFAAPGVLPVKPDYYNRITFKTPAGMTPSEAGIAGGEVIVTHDKNLYVGLEDSTGKYRLRVKDSIKSTQINVRVAAYVDFAIPAHMIVGTAD